MPHKILIVDDEPFMLRLIQHHLEQAGYELIKARNGREALEIAAREILGTHRNRISIDDCRGYQQHHPVYC